MWNFKGCYVWKGSNKNSVGLRTLANNYDSNRHLTAKEWANCQLLFTHLSVFGLAVKLRLEVMFSGSSDVLHRVELSSVSRSISSVFTAIIAIPPSSSISGYWTRSSSSHSKFAINSSSLGVGANLDWSVVRDHNVCTPDAEEPSSRTKCLDGCFAGLEIFTWYCKLKRDIYYSLFGNSSFVFQLWWQILYRV